MSNDTYLILIGQYEIAYNIIPLTHLNQSFF